MPGGQGGGGGWARLTAGEARSISGRNANTTADKALCCSQPFIAHLLSVAFCVGILRFVQCPGAGFSADGGDHGNDGVHWVPPSRARRRYWVWTHLNHLTRHPPSRALSFVPGNRI